MVNTWKCYRTGKDTDIIMAERKYVIFDVETTGLVKTDEVIQFSAIVLKENFKTETAVNFYCNTQVPINAQAFNVHHLDKAKLFKLSEGYSFEDSWLPFIESLRGKQVIWIDWSLNGFDERLINQTLVNNGLEDYFHFPRYSQLSACYKDMISEFHLMGALSKKFNRAHMKLEAAVNMLPYSRAQLDYAYEKIAVLLPESEMDMKYHNALYDTFMTYMLFDYYFGVKNE